MSPDSQSDPARALFQQWLDAHVLEAEPPEPSALCAENPELLPEVQALIESFRALDQVLPSPSGPTLSPESPPGQIPPRVAGYEIGELLGVGGMGEVWEAEQTVPVRRRVALKVVRSGEDRSGMLRRFEAERQAMAAMNHPAIARIFDAGTTASGVPYFAMERVEGLPITEHCDHYRASLRERLELFARVCHGVQHAHQKGIIHRDLKPSNVLVTTAAGEPQPRIIDFGIAKAVEPEMVRDGTLTRLGQVVGTPAYMSPEQLDPDLPDVDTRSDVYSLGILLYELLVGVRPFEQSLLSPRERERSLQTPSSRVTGLGHRGRDIANRRGTEVKALARRLRGDLDWIVLRALEVDREKRYRSPAALAEDLRRHLCDEPVLARPPAAAYLARKFVRRHRVAVTLAALAVLTLLGTLAGLAVGLDRARTAEQRARQESEIAGGVSEFLVGLFEQGDPKGAGAEPASVLEVLDRGASQVDEGLADQPLVRARLLATMARAYVGLGRFEEARELLDRSIEVQRELEPGSLDLATSFDLLADVHRQRGDLTAAGEAAGAALRLRREALPHDSEEMARSYRQMGTILAARGEYPQALENFDRARAILASIDPDGVELAKLLNNTAIVHWERRNLARAAELMAEGLEIFELRLGERHPHVGANLNNLGMVLGQSEDYSSAVELHRRSLAIREETLGVEHPDVAESLHNLGHALGELGNLDEAEAAMLRAVAMREQALGPDHPLLGSTLHNLGRLSLRRGDLAESREAQEEARRIFEVSLGPDHPHLSYTLVELAALDLLEGREADAEERLQRCLEIRERALGPDNPLLADCLEPRVTLLRNQGRDEEAAAVEERLRSLRSAGS